MAKRKEQSLPEINNPKAGRDYFIEQTFEAGLVLQGTEVKSLRLGRANIADAFIRLTPRGPVLFHAHITEYDYGNHHNHDPYRTRRLLLNAAEIDRLTEAVRSGGSTVIPLKLYFKHGLAKCLIAIGKGKKQHDRRQDIKEREAKREISRAIRRRQ